MLSTGVMRSFRMAFINSHGELRAIACVLILQDPYQECCLSHLILKGKGDSLQTKVPQLARADYAMRGPSLGDIFY